MNNLICVATGSFYKIFDDKELANKCADTFRNVDIDGIEFTMGKTASMLEITNENLEYIKSLKHVSIHAPFDIKYRETFEIQRLVSSLQYFYILTNAKNIIIHSNQIDNYELFRGMNYSTENLPKKSNIPISKYEELFLIFPKLKFTLDCGHALTHSKNELETLIEKFSNKIIQIHFHDYRNQEDHQLFHLTDDFKKYECLKEINVPVVIEQKFEKMDVNLLKREIDFVRKYFNK